MDVSLDKLALTDVHCRLSLIGASLRELTIFVVELPMRLPPIIRNYNDRSNSTKYMGLNPNFQFQLPLLSNYFPLPTRRDLIRAIIHHLCWWLTQWLSNYRSIAIGINLITWINSETLLGRSTIQQVGHWNWIQRHWFD